MNKFAVVLLMLVGAQASAAPSPFIASQIERLENQRNYILTSVARGTLKGEAKLCELFVNQFNDSAAGLPCDAIALDIEISHETQAKINSLMLDPSICGKSARSTIPAPHCRADD